MMDIGLNDEDFKWFRKTREILGKFSKKINGNDDVLVNSEICAGRYLVEQLLYHFLT